MFSTDAETIAVEAVHVDPAPPREDEIFAPDYYEILRISPQADEETIDRVYRTLADRFHPDNPTTGDPENFLRLTEAYETLSHPAKRAQYNSLRHHNSGSARFRLRAREFFEGVRGGQNRRLAVLCLLYREKIANYESQGLTILDLERLTGCTREELASALWYLCQKKWGTIGEVTAYSITVEGFDVVESTLEDRSEFRALATVSYSGLHVDQNNPAGVEHIATFRGDLFINDPASAHSEDHYAVLGIGPQADEDTIERVYGTLAARFDPNNPATGDAPTFLKIAAAYDTLSDPAKRRAYNASRQRARYSPRFRLEGREFFNGIKGEQLRRLAVLCILYREGASESPGLTVLDLEQLTGCTREELGSALWYLREKKWARSGEFTEYRISATGFDVVENKLEEQESAERREWPEPEVARDIATVPAQLVAVQQAGTIADIESEPHSEDAAGYGFEEPWETDGLWAGFCPEESSDEQPETKAEAPPEPELKPELPEISNMTSTLQDVIEEKAGGASVTPFKRVVLSMGGKGGVGKTSVMTVLAEWLEENRIPASLLDLDIENKARGSLTHFFGGRVPKINIHTPAGLDAFIDRLADEASVILADMGAGAGKVTHDWFEKMYPDVTEAGIVFTAIGVVTADPASVESVLNWAEALEHRVAYVVVENHLTEYTDFSYWRENPQAQEFRRRFRPSVIRMDNRLADLENATRSYGVTLGQVAGRRTSAVELQRASLVMRAQSYRRRMFEEFDRVKELLLP